MLTIDGKSVGTFSADQLAKGINLADYFTPMLRQAYHVSNIVWEEIQAHCVGRYEVQTMMENFDPWWTKPHPPNLPVTTENATAAAKAVAKIVRAIYGLETAIVAKEYAANKPIPCHYQLTPENDGKWGDVEPVQGTFNWSNLAAMYTLAAQRGIVLDCLQDGGAIRSRCMMLNMRH